MTRNGNPVAVLKPLDDDSHIKTRIAQYEALNKYGLELHDLDNFKEKIEKVNSDSLRKARTRLLGIKGKATEKYYKQIFELPPESIRIKKRFSWRAYDGIHNTFNLAYTPLKYKVHSAVLKAHLEPYLGLGKRQVLDKDKTKELTAKVYELWERKVVIPRIRHGKRQTIETLINEEAYLLTKYLRNERKTWKPRISKI